MTKTAMTQCRNCGAWHLPPPLAIEGVGRRLLRVLPAQRPQRLDRADKQSEKAQVVEVKTT